MAEPIPQGTMIVPQRDPWDEAFASYRQSLIDLNGDGVPDVAVPAQGRMSDAGRRRATVAGINPQEPAPGQQAGVMEALSVTGIPGLGLAGQGVNKLMSIARGAPGTTAATIGTTAALAPSAIAQNPNIPQATDLTPLMTQRASAEQKRSAAEAEMQRQQRSGRGPAWQSAKEAVDRATAEITALDQQISNAQRMNSPEYRLEMMRKSDEQAAQLRAQRANTPVKELYADYMPYVAPAAAIAAGIAGAAIRAPYAKAFNQEMADLSTRWKSAATGRSPNAELASELGSRFATRQAEGIGGSGAAVATGVGIGELSQLMPLAIDYQRALPGSPLRDKVMQEVTDPYALGGRMLQGALLGGIPAKVGSTAVGAGAQTYHRGYQAETAALRGAPGGPGGTPSPVPAGPAAALPAGQPVAPPPQTPSPMPNSPGRPPSPPYSADHSAVSRQYLDELLAVGQPLPDTRTMANELASRYAGGPGPVRPPDVTRRVNQTRPVVDALQGVDPAVQQQVLSAIMGRPGFLAIPAAAASAEPMNRLMSLYYGQEPVM